MARSFPVFLDVDTLDLAGIPAEESSPDGLLDGGNDVLSAMLVGVRAILTSNTGSVSDSIIIKIYEDGTQTEGLYEATFNFSSTGETLSDTLNTPIPFFRQPFITVNPTVGSTTMKVTLYVQAMA